MCKGEPIVELLGQIKQNKVIGLSQLEIKNDFYADKIIGHKWSLVKYLKITKANFRNRHYLKDKCAQAWYSFDNGHYRLYRKQKFCAGEKFVCFFPARLGFDIPFITIKQLRSGRFCCEQFICSSINFNGLISDFNGVFI